MKSSDISVCHRLPKRRNDMPPAITVRFVARNFKQVNLYSISKLKEQSADVFSSEDITLARNKALMQLEKKQLSCVVICDGNLHCHMKNNQIQKNDCKMSFRSANCVCAGTEKYQKFV